MVNLGYSLGLTTMHLMKNIPKYITIHPGCRPTPIPLPQNYVINQKITNLPRQ